MWLFLVDSVTFFLILKSICLYFFSCSRDSVKTSSTCCGSSRCCFTASRSTAPCRREMETSACCLLSSRRSSFPNWQVEKPAQLRGTHSDLLDHKNAGQCKICRVYLYLFVCVCVSVGRASVGSAVKQSDSQSGGLHSQTNERLPHCAAWRQQIHTGTVSSLLTCVNIMYFIRRVRDNTILVIFLFFPLSGTLENDSLKDQADSGWRCLPPTLPQNVCHTVLV